MAKVKTADELMALVEAGAVKVEGIRDALARNRRAVERADGVMPTLGAFDAAFAARQSEATSRLTADAEEAKGNIAILTEVLRRLGGIGTAVRCIRCGALATMTASAGPACADCYDELSDG